MSDAHNNLISVIAGHVDRIGYTFGRAEACLKRTGERADYWAMARRPVAQAFGEHPDVAARTRRQWVDLDTGSTSVHELKLSVGDLRADKHKPWRKIGARALGERRFYWLCRDGGVEPKHVDEDNGWGVVLFDAHQYRIVRPSAFFPCLYRDEHELLLQIAERKAYERQQVQQVRQQVPIARLATESVSVRDVHEKKKSSPQASARQAFAIGNGNQPGWVNTVIEELGRGPATTAALKRVVRQSHGMNISANKLADELGRLDGIVQAGVGGSWSLDAGAGDGAA